MQRGRIMRNKQVSAKPQNGNETSSNGNGHNGNGHKNGNGNNAQNNNQTLYHPKGYKFQEKGLSFKRVFTREDKNVFEQFEYEQRRSVIKNSDGSIVYEINNVEVPNFWSQVATDILAQKYIRKKGVPQFDTLGMPILDKITGKQMLGTETSVKQVAHRLAECWKDWAAKYNYFKSEQDAKIFYDETVYMLINQMGAPNSPQWFNTGLATVYDIRGDAQGHYYCEPETGELKKSEDAYTHPQPHACFIQAVRDDLVNEGGIFDLVTREARLFKYGSGTGTNFSSLRGRGEKLSGGGNSSGLMSFLLINDRAAGAIKSGGTTRRAAKMVSLDLDHPDIEEFITWKVKEEQKVAALVTGSAICKNHLNSIMQIAYEKKSTSLKENIALRKEVKKALASNVPINYIQRTLQLVNQGKKEIDFIVMDTHYESEAYNTVSGQNSNNSIRIPNKFFESLQRDDVWHLIRRTDKSIHKTLKASALWDKITYSAWMSADPGAQYDDTINEWHTCPNDGRINASNPCSEYMFLDDTACNLASLNLIKFYNLKEKQFEVEKFKHAVRIWTTILEISVLMAQFPGKEIARRSYLYRTLGLGYANVGALLMKIGQPYDSDEGRAIAASITAIMGGESYRTSAELSRALGPFSRYKENKDDMLRVIRNHRRAAHNAMSTEYESLTIKPQGLNPENCPNYDYLVKGAKTAWDDALNWGEEYGYRNAQVTVLAPTGTIGLLMDCDTTGVEPDFALVKFKKLAGGGYFKIVNQSVPESLANLGYTQQEIEKIVKYCVGHGTLKGSPALSHDTLKEKGFDDVTIMKIESALPTAFELKFAFSKWTIGDEKLKELGFNDEQIKDPTLNVLEALSFSKADIEKAEEYVCGTMTVEGAPGIKNEHLPIFDCANKCGKKGKRYIDYMGHIKMMSSVQPYLSGAISKTINMDKSATIKDISDAYIESWKLMVKAVALYRDGSKLSQPLNATTEDEAELLMIRDSEEIDETVGPKQIQEHIIYKLRQKKMPHKRLGFIQEAVVGGQKVFLRTGEYEDGTLGEIFLDTYKEGASYGALLNCFAIAISKALQYGVPIEEFVDSFTFTRFEPSGPVTGHPVIKNATSILDYIFRVLGYEYLGRKDFVHVKTMEASDTKVEPPKLELPKEKQLRFTDRETESFEAKSKGYTGEQCTSCGSMKLKRSGSCSVCEDCGNTTGCS
jgi:ribonucleoside-diphosphate reductase alpha chain